MSDNPSLTEVIEGAIEGYLDDVQVALPGRIESYNAETRRATVQLLMMEVVYVDGERIARERKPLTDVPVMLSGSGDVRIKFPIKRGDPCLMMFAASSIAVLKSTDGTKVVDPKDDRRHSINDGYAIPMPRLRGAVEDEAMIEFTDGGLIRAGGDEPLVTRSEFLNHTHATAGTGTPSPPITSAAPGSAATFPGTDKLRG